MPRRMGSSVSLRTVSRSRSRDHDRSYPLHRSGRAELPHPAPALGEDAQAHERIGITDIRQRKPATEETPHAAPRQVVALAAMAQGRVPQETHGRAKGHQCRPIHGHSVITKVAQEDRAQIGPLLPNGRVHASPQFLFQGPQLSLPPLAHRLSQYREVPLPCSTAAMRKTQEVEGLRFAVSPVSPIWLRKATKFDDSRLVGMQLEAEPRESLAQFCQKLLCFMAMLKARNEVIGKTNEDYVSVRLPLSPSLDPEVENIVEIDVRQQRADAATLNGSYLTLHSLALFQHARLQPFLDFNPTHRPGYVRSSLESKGDVLKRRLEGLAGVLPPLAIDACCSLLLSGQVGCPQSFHVVNVVQERSEPLLLSRSCCLTC